MKELFREVAAGLLMSVPVLFVVAWELPSGPARSFFSALGVLTVVGFGLRGIVRLLQKYEKL